MTDGTVSGSSAGVVMLVAVTVCYGTGAAGENGSLSRGRAGAAGAVVTGLLCALAAAVAGGVAVVLQAVAARRQPAESDLRVRLVVRLVRSPAYLAGLALTALGFVLALIALRHLPLFVVQAARASSLGVTAFVAVPLLGARLRRPEIVSLLGVAVGLTLLGMAAQTSPAPSVSFGGRGLPLGAFTLLTALASWVARLPGPGSAYPLAALAGAGFATLGVAARVLVDPTDPASLVTDPAAWALAGSGALALLTFATALQRAHVTGVTATMVATETLLASAIGILLLGDSPAAGRWPLAALGFAITVAGALGVTGAGTPAPAPTGPASHK